MLPCLMNRRGCPFQTTPPSQRQSCALHPTSLRSTLNTRLLLFVPSSFNFEFSTLTLPSFLDAASSISPFLATLTKNTGGWVQGLAMLSRAKRTHNCRPVVTSLRRYL